MPIPRLIDHRSVFVTAVLAALVGAFGVAAPSAQAADGHWVYSGRAVAFDNGPYSPGHVADTVLCSTSSTASASRRVPSQSVPSIATFAAATSDVHGTGTGVTSTSTISKLSLLGGMVTASSITTSASISYAAPNFVRSYSASVDGLSVNGPSGTTTSGEQTFVLGDGIYINIYNTSATLTQKDPPQPGKLAQHSSNAIAITLYVGANNTGGYPAGTYFFGHVGATLHDPITYLPWGTGGGSSVQVGGVSTHPLKNRASIYCGGNDGLATSASSSDAVPGVVTAGPARSTAYSAPLGLSATTTHDVTNVSILGGLVSAGRITAKASAARAPGHFTSSISGTAITGLAIRGTAYTKTIAPNTVIPIDGVGTLSVERVITYRTGVRVYALQLVLTHDYLGVKAGTTISVGTASSGVFNS